MDAISLEAVLIPLMVLLSALFSGMETALVSLSDVKLRTQADSGAKMPRMLRRWLEQPNDVLASLLIWNNLVNITASAFATSLTERLLEGSPMAGWGIPIAIGVTTLAILIVGEVVPKTYAKHNPEAYAAFIPIFTPFFALSFGPMVLLVALTRRIVTWMGGELTTERARITEEDIEEMVRVGTMDGSIDPGATRLLTGVLELDEKVAREIMVPRPDVHGIALSTPIAEVLNAVSESGFSRYPVYGESIDDMRGVLYVRDLLAAVLLRGREAVDLAETIRPPMILPENMPLPDLLVAMKQSRTHMAIIASEYGGVAGIVTLEDIVEEVFGDIYDEHDVIDAQVRRITDDVWMVDGVVTVSDLEDALGPAVDLNGTDDEDYETVAGLLMHVAGRMPEQGFTHTISGFELEVVRADSTRISEVAVRRLPPPSSAAPDEATG
ncbi:MAG: HlyC/CorC family transporter [Deltaproteobacteria bacterium]|nr:HlyC/CorC family transporter [Deltaproteobacteria bacterium]MCB9785174.1 HlyC/CorC family transporter [Deltaproteobacteria bacterium]